MARKRLGEILLEAGAIREDQLATALREQQRWGGQLGNILINKRFIGEDDLVGALSRQLNIDIVKLDGRKIDKDVVQLIGVDMANKYCILPFNRDGRFLDVAMSDPLNLDLSDELRIRTQLLIRPYFASPTEIQRAIRRAFAVKVVDGITMDRGFDEVVTAKDAGSAVDEPTRAAEIRALQERLTELEALVARDENVLRKLMHLLISKGVASRDEIMEAIR